MRSFALVSAVILASSSTAIAGAPASQWIGPRIGNWNLGTNWSPSGVPTNVPVSIAPRGGATVTLDLQGATLPSFTLGAGSTLLQPDGIFVYLDSAQNDGLWILNGTGNATDVRLTAPEVLFGGSGALDLGANANNRVFGWGGNRTLVNGPSHTVRGGGSLGLNIGLSINNQGVVEATAPTPLTVDLIDAPNMNTGLMVARDGSVLRLLNTNLDNSGGTIRAEGSGVVSLEGGSVTGGTLATDELGSISATGNGTNLIDAHVTGTLRIPNGANLYVTNSLLNEGAVLLESAGAASDLRLLSDVTLSGSGDFRLGSANDRIFGWGGTRRLTNAADHTIHGSGNLGVNIGLNLTNHGTLESRAGEALMVDLTDGTGSNFNPGLVVARDGGVLTLLGTSLDNSDGTIRAEGTGVVALNNSTVLGGTFTTGGNGSIQPSASGGTLIDVTNEGLFLVPNGQVAYLVGSFENVGTTRLEAAGAATDLRVLGDEVVLSGAGTLELAGDGNSRVFGWGGLRRLVNGESHVISGGGQLGVNALLNLTNEGLIEAVGPISLTVDLFDGANYNNGLMQARDGGTLAIQGTPLDNSNGTILAQGTGVVRLLNSTITGGILTSADGAAVRVTNSGPTLVDAHNEGLLTWDSGGSLYLISSLVNDGTCLLDAGGQATDVRLLSDSSIGGTGTLVMQGGQNSRFMAWGGFRHLTHEAGHTIRGSGQIGINSQLDVTNAGAIVADAAAGITIDAGQSFLNEGSIHVTDQGWLLIQPSGFVNHGSVAVDAGLSAQSNATYVQTKGSTRVDGTFTVSGGSSVFALEGGKLGGTGTVVGPVDNDAGTIDPSLELLDPIGTLHIQGHYTQAPSGTLAVRLGLGGNDLLAINGVADVSGAIAVQFEEGFVPMPGMEFVVLTATSVNGYFSCLETPSLANGYFQVVVQPTQVKLVVTTTPPVPADVNLDGLVNAADLAILLGSWGTPGCNGDLCCPSDLNQDSFVDAFDLAIMLGAWQ